MNEEDEYTVLEIIGYLTFADYSILASPLIYFIFIRDSFNLSVPYIFFDIHVTHEGDAIKIFTELDHIVLLVETPFYVDTLFYFSRYYFLK